MTSKESINCPHTINIETGKPTSWLFPLDDFKITFIEEGLLKLKIVLCHFCVKKPPMRSLSDLVPLESLYDTLDKNKDRDKEFFNFEHKFLIRIRIFDTSEAEQPLKESRRSPRVAKQPPKNKAYFVFYFHSVLLPCEHKHA